MSSASFSVEFIVPLHVEDLVLDLDNRITVQSRAGPDPHRVKIALSEAEGKLESDPVNIYQNEVFDPLYWIVSDCGTLPHAERKQLFDLICDTLSHLVSKVKSIASSRDFDPPVQPDRVHLARCAVKMLSFLLSTAVSRMYRDQLPAESVPKSGKSRSKAPTQSDWSELKGRVACVFLELLEEKTLKRLWTMGEPEEEFGNLFLRTGILLIEDKDNSATKNASLRNCIFDVLSRAITLFSLQLQAVASLLSFAYNSERAAVVTAAFLAHDFSQNASSTLTYSLLLEIGRLDLKQISRELQSCKSLSVLLVELAGNMPAVIAQGMQHILPLLSSDAYTVRNGIIRTMAALVEFSDKAELDEEAVGALVQLLLQRFLDVSSYTRAAAIAVWKSLSERGRIPVQTLSQLTEAAAGRLLDKSLQVRKAAIQLFTVLLQHNPFAPVLNVEEFRGKQTVLEQQISSLEEAISQVQIDDRADMDIDETTGSSPSDLRSSAVQEFQALSHENLQWTFAIQFMERIQEIFPTMISLLSSKSNSDALAAVEFVITAHDFGVPGSDVALHRMLPLVYSKQTEVKDAVIGAYNHVYVESRPSNDVARFLVLLASRITVTEATCLEVIVAELVRSRQITHLHLNALLAFFKSSGDILHVRAALDVITMASLAEPDLVSHNIVIILKRGFDWAPQSAHLVRSACMSLQRVVNPDVLWIESDSPKRNISAANLSAVFSHLRLVLSGQIATGSDWFAACGYAMDALFKLHPTPDQFVGTIIRGFSEHVFGAESDTNSGVDVRRLAQLFFLTGHSAIRMLVYHEQLESHWKRTRAAKRDEAQDEGGDGELEAIGGDASGEHEMEALRERAQNMLTDGRSLIGAIAPCITAVVGNPSQYPDERLQMSASLALCKIMCTSSDFCERHLRLLFTVLEKADSPGIRANLIIALGDLAFRFPNLIDPWTSRMYAPLKDPVPGVRKNCLMVLSHLILNDMIKVKGEISSVTLCLEDPDTPIRDLAHLFFSELSRKSHNPIYNVLPDTISRLSQIEQPEDEIFKRIAKFLIDSIDKERQVESLVEKFCHRFPATQVVQHWRNYAFCISCLSVTNPKTVMKFMSLSKMYNDKLEDDEVYNSLRSIILKAKKTTDVDFSEALEEFDIRMQALHSCEDPDEAVKRSKTGEHAVDEKPKISQSNTGAAKRTDKKSSKKVQPKTPRRTTRRASPSGETVGTVTKKSRSRKGSRKHTTTRSDDDESDTSQQKTKLNPDVLSDDGDDFENERLMKPTRKQRSQPARRQRKIIYESSDDDDNDENNGGEAN